LFVFYIGENLMKAIRIHQHGDPEVLVFEEAPRPEPGPGEARVRLQAVGVNYIDTYHRRGLYEVALPFVPGMEGSGIVDAVGDGVNNVAVGDRVAYAMQLGAYAEYTTVPAWRLVKLPGYLDADIAAAVMLQGMTAHYLTHSTYAVQEGDHILVHAAAGGMGLLLVQMAKLRGAQVIGTTSTAEKAGLAREYGADHIIPYTEVDFAAAALELTHGEGVNVVYDGVGQKTFLQGLDCLRPRGYMVLYGQASGPVPPLNPQILNQKGSLFLTRPSLGHYAASTEEIHERTADIFNWIGSGSLKVRIDRHFPLAEAAAAHRYIEGRQTKGKLLLSPDHPDETLAPGETINTADPVDESSWESFPASDPPPY
jgi:NADPH2:quinone reductase